MLRAGALAACCFCVMSCGGDSEEQRHPGPSRVIDSNQLGRRSLSKSGAGDEIDERLLIDPKMLYVGKKIGEGAHGRVYEGKYSGQIVAIKVLSGGSTVEEKATLGTRFVREVNLMSRVKHENLVEFVGACRSPFMVVVTELLPGMSLKKYLRSIRPKQLDLHVAVGFALEIAHAVECLHANGIIHRDLKPGTNLHTHFNVITFYFVRSITVNY